MSEPVLTPQEITDAIRIAGELIDAGIPVFAAPPCPPGCTIPGHGERTEFHLPPKWQLTYPSRVWLDRWQPGWALAAVGGHSADFIDEDPRSGGDVSIAELVASGDMPRIFGVAGTPSNGRHYLISPLGEREANMVMPGIDYQGGDESGQGRAFVWIAPTVKRSKAPDTMGELRPYHWIDAPDLGLLKDFAGSDDSGHGFVARLRAARDRGMAPVRPASDDDQLFTQPSRTHTSAGAADQSRSFTRAEAEDFVRPALLRLRSAVIGEIEECANRAAVTLAHFVPAFWDADAAYGLLTDALSYTAYDPNGPSDWTAEKFRPVLDGRRPPRDPWRAVRRPETSLAGRMVTGAPGGATASSDDAVAALLAEMVTADAMMDRKPPPYLVHTLLTLDSLAWLIGAPGSKKSFVALDMAAHVATGRVWQGMKVRQGRVVVIAAEGAGGLGPRLRAWQSTNGPIGDALLVLPRSVQASESEWAVLVEACRQLQPVMVIADTQARMTVGMEENSATEMGMYVKAVDAIRQATGACVLSVHHTGRNGGDARGSSAIDGAQDTELNMTSSGMSGVLKTDKQKNLPEKPDVTLRFTSVHLGMDEENDPITSLVLLPPGDAFDAASREGGGVYVPTFHEKDVWRQRIIDALYLHAPDGGWLISDLCARLEQDYGVRGLRRNGGFTGAWKHVLALVDPSGEPVIARPSAQRFEIGSLSTRAGLALRFPRALDDALDPEQPKL